jgi:diaminohydroxyphosphoribosylaminopyrimidine deaminase / 5-amino-6-(5-phosphoribosylamino)uracil reductase
MSQAIFMQRCIDLALLGAGYVAPNPMVGAVLVHEGKIIGEGWHQRYGEAHAEPNCIASIKPEHRHLISQSTMYVTLEPCAHHGKTPPCADLLIARKVQKVVIGCLDPFKKVDGRGVEKLSDAGIETELNVLEAECRELNKRFFTFHTLHRPYIILKWAQTADNIIGSVSGGHRLLISNEYTNRLVHRWRSEEAAILVGTNTALQDNPALTTRSWEGPSPVRLVIDKELRLPSSLKLFDRSVRTVVFNTRKHEEQGNLLYYQVTRDVNLVHQVVNALYQLNIQSVLVEGGAQLLQSFIDEGLWDEARVIRNNELKINEGLPAPILSNAHKTDTQILISDTIELFKPSRVNHH